jgi:hypothetical protein
MTEVGPAGHKRPGSRRSELERLIDRTVLGPTHPELETCWQFTGTTTPRIWRSGASRGRLRRGQGKRVA